MAPMKVAMALANYTQLQKSIRRVTAYLMICCFENRGENGKQSYPNIAEQMSFLL